MLATPLVIVAILGQSGLVEGKNYTLAQEGNPIVLLFRTQEAWQAAQVAGGKDLPAFFALAESNKAFRVRGLATRAKLLQVVPGKVSAACVMILSGPEAGAEGWVRTEHLKEGQVLESLRLEAAHKQGETYLVGPRDGQEIITATTDEGKYRSAIAASTKGGGYITEIYLSGDLFTLLDFRKDKPIEAKFLRLLPGHPVLAEVEILGGPRAGDSVVVADECLMGPLEIVFAKAELERARNVRAAEQAKLDGIDPAEFRRAIKQARLAANQKDLSLRRSAFEREKKAKLSALAKKLGLKPDLLIDYVTSKGYDKE